MSRLSRYSLIALAAFLLGAWALGSGVLGSAWHGLRDGAACANGAAQRC
jgi:hypothetical protein